MFRAIVAGLCVLGGLLACGAARAQATDADSLRPAQPGEVASSSAVPLAPQPLPTPDALYVEGLLRRRDALLSRRIGFTAPITLLSIGAVFMVGGSALSRVSGCSYEEYDGYGSCSSVSLGELFGATVMVSGAAVGITGASMLVSRVIKRHRRRHQLQSIEGELRHFVRLAEIRPWMMSGGRDALGVQARLRF
ncbi:MAG: hypothetical protein RL385_1980 [Pseudomonadota bacterium]|jgi:hypothetical protein